MSPETPAGEAPKPETPKVEEPKPAPKRDSMKELRERVGQRRDKAVLTMNSRTSREKKLILAFAAAILIVIDYFVLLHPTIDTFMRVSPALSEARVRLDGLRDDRKNAELIERKWTQMRERLDTTEKRFIAPGEIPRLLENLSQLAQESNVKILTLRPVDVADPEPGPYVKIPIRISALAGTHELGAFLARLEGAQTFFRVTDLKIKEYPPDPHRHSVDLRLEGYRRGLRSKELKNA